MDQRLIGKQVKGPPCSCLHGRYVFKCIYHSLSNPTILSPSNKLIGRRSTLFGGTSERGSRLQDPWITACFCGAATRPQAKLPPSPHQALFHSARDACNTCCYLPHRKYKHFYYRVEDQDVRLGTALPEDEEGEAARRRRNCWRAGMP
jgi:hypothetical protein